MTNILNEVQDTQINTSDADLVQDAAPAKAANETSAEIENKQSDEVSKLNAKKNELLGKLKSEKSAHEESKAKIASLTAELESLKGVKEEFLNFRKKLAWDYFLDMQIVPIEGMREFINYELSKQYQIIEKEGKLFVADKENNIIQTRDQIESIRDDYGNYVAFTGPFVRTVYKQSKGYSLLTHDLKIEYHQGKIKYYQDCINAENRKIQELKEERSKDDRLPELNFALK